MKIKNPFRVGGNRLRFWHSSRTQADDADQQSLREHLRGWPDQPSTGYLEWAAERRGIETKRVPFSRPADSPPQEWLHLSIGSNPYLYRNSRLLRHRSGKSGNGWKSINGAAVRLTANKHRMKGYLKDRGFSVPAGLLFRSSEIRAATDYFRSLARQACVKPNRGQGGDRVYIGLTSVSQFEDAFHRISEAYDEIVVEEQVAGDVLRFHYVSPNVTATRLDIPANVTGDGQRTIRELVEEKNGDRWTRNLPGHFPIMVDEEVERYLDTQELSLASVPALGRRVFVRATSNLSTGGDGIQQPRLAHSSYVQLVEKMAATISGLRLAGLDIAVKNRRAPVRADNYHVLEVNSAPGLVVHFFPWDGAPHDVANDLIDRLLSEDW